MFSIAKNFLHCNFTFKDLMIATALIVYQILYLLSSYTDFKRFKVKITINFTLKDLLVILIKLTIPFIVANTNLN